MKNYIVYLTEETTHIITVQAESREQAGELAHEYYDTEPEGLVEGVGHRLRHEGVTHTEVVEVMEVKQ